MIAIQNIIDNDKNLLTVLFDRNIMQHLKCKCHDCLFIMQSNFNPSYFLMLKADTGYKIKRHPKIKKIYQVDISYKFIDIPEFDLKECIYFLRKNNTIRIILNNQINIK